LTWHDWPTKVGNVASRHLFVCTNGRASGKPACGPRGGDALVAAVQRELIERGALGALVTTCGCLGPCFDGPNAVVYPDDVWYADLAASDAAALVDHLIDGRVLAAKVSQRPGALANGATSECDDRTGNDR
jgi:(2Fe-2S) ferredoxin